MSPPSRPDGGEQFAALADLARSLSAARRAKSDLGRSFRRVVRDGPAVFAWLRGLPTLDVAFSDSVAGQSTRRAVLGRHNWLFSGRAVAVLEMPDSVEEYLRGRHRQAVRTNRRRGLALGLLAERARSRDEARRCYQTLNEHEVLYATRVHLRERIDEWALPVWFVHSSTGDCVAAAVVAVDGDIARLDLLQVALDLPDRSAAQYLLSTEIIASLIQDGVRHLLTDSTLFSPAGVVYLEQRLGFRPMNLRERRRSCPSLS